MQYVLNSDENKSALKCIIILAIFIHRDGGWGEQFNKQTAFIDASAVYGCHQVDDGFPYNLDVVEINENFHIFLRNQKCGSDMTDRDLLRNYEVGARGREVASSPTRSFQTFFQATST